MVGDPHAEQSELDDCRALVDLLVHHVKLWKPDLVLFLGDQHHNHALVHLEVLGFWKQAFDRIKEVGKPFGTRIATLVGNHDMPGNGSSKNHAMLAYDIEVADKILVLSDHCAAISYCGSEEEFLTCLNALPTETKTVFCHQTFDGSKYENGFYAKDGFNLEGLERWEFISGHIHTPQEFANVKYVGAPRWRTVSDANVDRYIWCMELDNGVATLAGKIATDTHCNPMYYYIDREQEPINVEDIDLTKGQTIVDIYGAPEWVDERVKLWGNSRIRTFPVVERMGSVQESKGIHVALAEYMDAYKPSESIKKEDLRAIVNKRLGLSL